MDDKYKLVVKAICRTTINGISYQNSSIKHRTMFIPFGEEELKEVTVYAELINKLENSLTEKLKQLILSETKPF